MYRGDAIEAKVISFATGGGVHFILGPLTALAVGDGWLSLYLMTFVCLVTASMVAFIWPQLGWRTGLWFFAFFPPMALASFLLTLEIPINWRGELTALLMYSISFLGVCLGGWIGSTLRRRSSLTHAAD